ncbi:MAG: energy-coupling factor ABC transporter ATP-binding protein [Treponema sp.]|nr:energy-coupling factor ABC transporter ATP-binding protein [Treponema sp.]
MIRIRDFSFRYKDAERDAISHLSLDVADGEFLGIIGPSGAGKTTLCWSLAGLVPLRFPGAFYGEIRVNDRDTIDAGPEGIAAEAGFVFQDIESQITASVVEDEMLFGLENFGVPRADIEERVSWALRAAGIEDLRERTIDSLSGGQKQKVVIAAAAALRPKIIILDEPTGELDPCSSRMVFEFLADLNRREGTTIIVIEQKIMLLCEFARRLAVFDAGRMLVCAETREVLRQGETLEAAGVNIPRVCTLGRVLAGKGLYAGPLPRDLSEGIAMMREVCGA